MVKPAARPPSSFLSRASQRRKSITGAIAERRRARGLHPLAGRQTVFVYFCEAPKTQTGCGGCCSRFLAGYCIFWQFAAYLVLFIARSDAFDCEEYGFTDDGGGVEEGSNRERTLPTKVGISLLLIVVAVNVSHDLIVAWNCFKWDNGPPYQKIGALHLALAVLAVTYGSIIIYGSCNLLDALRDALALFFVNELSEAMFSVIGLCGCASQGSWSDFFSEGSYDFIGPSAYYFFTTCSWQGHLVGWATFSLQIGVTVYTGSQAMAEAMHTFDWERAAVSGYSRSGLYSCQQLTNESGVVEVETPGFFNHGVATGIFATLGLMTFVVINVSDDLSRGFKCLRRCHLAAGFAFIVHSVMMLTFTSVLIANFSCSLLDGFKNGLALLFVNDLDEHAYALLKAVFPKWVEAQAEYEVCGKAARAVAKAAKPRGATEPAGAPSAAPAAAGEGSAEDDAAAQQMDNNDGYALTAYQFLRFEGCTPTNSGWRFAACVAALQLSMVLTVVVWSSTYNVDCGGLELLTPCHASCTGVCSDDGATNDWAEQLNATIAMVYPCCSGPDAGDCQYASWQLDDDGRVLDELSSGELVPPERLRMETMSTSMEGVLTLGTGQLVREAESPFKTETDQAVLIAVVVGANTLLELHKARRCFSRRHYVLCALHLFFFLGAVTFAAVVATQSCTFLEAFLDALSLLFIFELDKQAYTILDELGLAHAFERQARVSEAMSRRLSEHSLPLANDPSDQPAGKEAAGAYQGAARGGAGGSEDGAQTTGAGESVGVEMPIAQPIAQPTGAQNLPVAVPAVPVVINAAAPASDHPDHLCSTSVKRTSQML